MANRFPARLTVWSLAGALVCLSGLAVLRAAEKPVSDADIAAMFQTSHGVMKKQQARLHAILDGFLLGDLDLVQQQAEAIGKAMDEVALHVPPKAGAQAEQWTSMAKIVEEAQALRDTAQKGQYQQAYQHYTALANQCMMCHQARRDWGTFPAPKPAGQDTVQP